MQKEKQLMRRTVLFLLLSSLSLLLTSIGSYQGAWWNVAAAIGVGVGFWVFLILGWVSFFLLSKRRKAQEKQVRSAKQKRKPGIITFFSHPYATAADIAMVISFIGSLAFQFFPLSEGLSLVFITVLVFSAQMHCILNGINFHYIFDDPSNKNNRRPARARESA